MGIGSFDTRGPLDTSAPKRMLNQAVLSGRRPRPPVLGDRSGRPHHVEDARRKAENRKTISPQGDVPAQ